jgi:hypothetical protein
MARRESPGFSGTLSHRPLPSQAAFKTVHRAVLSECTHELLAKLVRISERKIDTLAGKWRHDMCRVSEERDTFQGGGPRVARRESVNPVSPYGRVVRSDEIQGVVVPTCQQRQKPLPYVLRFLGDGILVEPIFGDA